ncbi:MAG TPA: nucleotidyltransferase domain-containing protein [Trueperaceae bacterium]|nr:nucleotidyltransferase domain-containing protein [Trueperaceae bacterium]
MNLSEPATVLLTQGDAKALSVLAGTTRPLSGREIARLGGGNPATTWRSLTRLADHGLLHVQEAGAGAALLYVLNRDHLAADAVQTLVDLRGLLVDRLKAEVAQWKVPPLHASLFGSAARGDGNTSSDIDLFVVQPKVVEDEEKWGVQLERLAAAVLRWTGNHAAIAEVTVAQAAGMAQERRPIVNELLRDGVWLFGLPVRELLSEVST